MSTRKKYHESRFFNYQADRSGSASLLSAHSMLHSYYLLGGLIRGAAPLPLAARRPRSIGRRRRLNVACRPDVKYIYYCHSFKHLTTFHNTVSPCLVRLTFMSWPYGQLMSYVEAMTPTVKPTSRFTSFS